MTYIVAEPCIGRKDRSCVEVCPVDCFYDHDNSELNKNAGKEAAPDGGGVGMLVIHPDECIHCGACEPECPVEAIYEDDEVPEKWVEYVELNATVVAGYSEEELEAKRVSSKE